MTKHHNFLLTGLLSAALSTTAFASTAQAQKIRFATAPWPGATVKTEVASQLLTQLGYDTSVKEASTSIILEGMVSGDIDINMALWRPSQSHMLDPRIESGELVEIVKNIKGARYRLAVPSHVWRKGVHSMADLAKHADRFNHRIYGIEPGNVGNEISQKAIDENIYDLGDWSLVASSVSGMLTQVDTSTRDGRWTVFQAWEPHWMNVEYDVRYLEDPENLWGKDSSVSTVANTNFIENHPNVERFLEQMTVPIEVQNSWVKSFSQEDRPRDEVAREWIDKNPDIIDLWLEGVTTVNGNTFK